MSQTILLKVHSATKTLAEHTIITKDGQPTIIKAQSRVNYELLDPNHGTAPNHIITKRVGKDLHISLEQEGKDSDIIIKDYYSNPNSAIIGLGEDGQYYYYIPDTGEAADFVANLVSGDIEGQAIGGQPLETPWWMGAGEFGFWPWLLALGMIENDDKDPTPPVAPGNAPDLINSSDTGVSNTDNNTADNTPTFTIPAPLEGETPVLFVDGVEVPSTFNPATNTITPVSPLSDGEYKIATATRKDGMTSVASPALTINVDTMAPVIKTAEVPTTGDTLVLTYDEPLNPTNTAAPTDFKVTVDGTVIVPTAVAVNGNQVTLTVPATDVIKKGQAVSVTYTDPSNTNDTKATQDVVDNDAATVTDFNVTNNSTVVIPPVAPGNAPDLINSSDTGVSNTDNNTADNTPTFTIPAPLEGETPVLFVDGVEVPSTFNPATNTITPVSPLSDGEYKIATATRKDGMTSVASPALTINVDTMAPVIKTAEVPTTGDTLVLTYDEPLNPTNTAAPTDFKVTVDGTVIVPTAVAVNGNQVTLTVPATDVIKKGQAVSVTYTDPSNTNDTKATQDVVDNDAATVTDFNVTNNSTVVIPPVAPGNAPDLINSSDTGVSNTDNNTADNTPTFTIPAPLEGETPVLFVDGVEVPSTFNPATNTITPVSPLSDGEYKIATATRKDGMTSVASPALTINVDTMAPVIKTAEVPTTGDTLVLTYDEPLNPTNTAAPTDFKVTVDGTVIVPTAVAVNGNQVTLTVPATDVIKKGQAVSVTYTDPSNTNDTKATQDVVDNDAATVTDFNVTNNSTVVIPPVAPGNAPDLINSSDTGVSNTDNNTADNTPTFTIPAPLEGETPVLFVDGVEVPSTFNPATNTITPVSPLSDGEYKIATATRKDGMTSVASPALTINVDTMAPVIKTAEVPTTGDTLVLTYDEPLNPTNTAAPTDFKVTVDGTVIVPTAVAVNGNQVTLTVPATDVIKKGQAVSVTYTDPSNTNDTKATQDVVDNDAATVTDFNVTNNSTVVIPPVAPGNAPDLINSSDTGVSNTDNNTADNTPTFTIPAPLEGETPVLFVDGVEVPSTFNPATNTITPVSPLSDGEYKIATATRKDGMTSVASPALTINVDTMAPVIKTAEVPTTGDTLVLTYDEPLNPTNTAAPTDFKVTVDGTVIVPTAVAVNGNQVTLTVPATDVIKKGQAVSVTYTDPSNTNDTKATQDVVDNDAATVTDFNVTNNSTVVIPPVAPGNAPDLINSSDTGVSNTDNNTADNTPTFTIPAPLEGETPVLFVDGVEVPSTFNPATNTITPVSPLSDGEYKIATATRKDGMTSVASPALTINVDTMAPVIKTAEVPTTGDTLVLTYDEPLNPTNTAAPTDFKVTVDGTVIVPTAVAVNGNQVTLTVPATDVIKKGQAVSVTYTDPSNTNDTKATQDVVDNDAATVTDFNVTNNSTVVIPPVAPGNAPDLINSSDTGVSNTDNNTADNTPTFTIPAPLEGETPVLFVDGVEVPSTFNPATNTITPVSPLSDGEYKIATATRKDGMTSATSDELPIVIDTMEPSEPTVQIGNRDEYLTANEINAADRVSVVIRLPADIKEGDRVLVNGAEYRVGPVHFNAKAMAVPVIAPAEGQTLTVNAQVKDMAGNLSPITTTDALRDTIAPSIQSARVLPTGTELVLTYDEALDPANAPTAENFKVNIDSKEVVPTAVMVAGNQVTLTLSTIDTVKAQQTVKVSYTDPTTNNDAEAIQDAAGNDSATVTDFNVANDSAVPAVILGTPVAGTTVTDVNMTVPTNDIKLSNINATFGRVVDSSREMTPDADGKTIAWPGIRGGTASIKLQDNAAGVVDGEDINSTFEVAAILHSNVPTTINLRQTSINLEATITLNGKDTRLNTTEIGTVYMLETPRNSSGNLIPGVPDEDFFIFVPKPISLTIDGQLYSFNLAATNINDSNTNRALVENALPIIDRGSYRTTIPAGLRNLTEAEKATAIYTSSPETGSENLVQFGFKLEPVSAGAIRPVGLPAPYTGQVADTNAAWTSGTAQGVTITAKSANTFAVNKNGVEIGEFAGQANGSYTFKPTADIKGIDGGETLIATFNKGDHTVNLNLTGKFSNHVAAGEDLVDTIYTIKAESAKDIDFKLIGDVEMIDLSQISGVNLQNITKDQLLASNNNQLYIKGDVGDNIVLGDVLQIGSPTQTDGTGRWTKGATKTGSTIDGDTNIYDTWTHNDGTTVLYIDQGITVI